MLRQYFKKQYIQKNPFQKDGRAFSLPPCICLCVNQVVVIGITFLSPGYKPGFLMSTKAIAHICCAMALLFFSNDDG